MCLPVCSGFFGFDSIPRDSWIFHNLFKIESKHTVFTDRTNRDMDNQTTLTTTVISRLLDDASEISSVTCYRDRAEVERVVTLEASEVSNEPNEPTKNYELILTGLTSKSDEDSIRVSSLISENIAILEVSSFLQHQSVDDEDVQSPVGKARALVTTKKEELEVETSNLSRIKERDSLLKGFLLTNLVTKESNRTPDEVMELLKFQDSAGKSNDKELREAKKAVSKAEKDLRAAEKMYREAFGER